MSILSYKDKVIGGFTSDARAVNFDKTGTALECTNVEDVIKEINTKTEELNTNLGIKANWELLWSDDNGVAAGSGIDFDRKNYKDYAFRYEGGMISLIRVYADTVKTVKTGCSNPLYDGGKWIGSDRICIFDAYPGRFFFHINADYDYSGGVWSDGRAITAIYGISKI